MNLLYAGLIFFGLTSIRYLSMSAIYYWIMNNYFGKYKIKTEKFNWTEHRQEIFWAVANNLNFGFWGAVMYWMYLKGYTRIYWDAGQYGYIYLGASVPVLLLTHDTYFYWAHRSMHRWDWMWKLCRHHIHHKFKNPSAWTAFSVHPMEGFFEIAYRPLIIMILPLHPIAILSFAMISFALNILGHSGFEIFPRGYSTFSLTKLGSSATHHFLHHREQKYNFSLYFTIWDKLMKTESSDYHQKFEAAAANHAWSLPSSQKK